MQHAPATYYSATQAPTKATLVLSGKHNLTFFYVMAAVAAVPVALSAPKTSLRYRRLLKGIALTFAITLVASTLFKAFIAETFYVPSGSMKETLQISDHFVVTRFASEINRGDIVVFYDSLGWTARDEDAATLRRNPFMRTLKMAGVIPSRDNDIMVKRVIGVGGDHIVCCNVFAQIELNGQPLNETAYLAPGVLPSKKEFEVTVPANSLFLLGDNRGNSADSRKFIDHPAGPFVALADVVGRATHTFWPLSNARAHENPYQPEEYHYYNDEDELHIVDLADAN